MMPIEATQSQLHLRHVLQASIQVFDSDEGSFEEGVEMLRAVLPDTTIIAALDLIDRDGVVKYSTSWGQHHYEVLGTTSTYAVFPHLNAASTVISSYCTCPSFAYAVLISESHLMCKHVLAVCLADRMSRCVVRPIEDDSLLLKLMGRIPPP
ncbi:hypothetical protein K503DRAFT_708818 [Rhizopogon vinicolor AM-OR11-026]|uniref:SWIM-type domain-containing protein n=1 Tax=Rhizopogon vinicolor AM-OR11-026 TaxID=1314800 RepID=A0A1B7NEL8_9AGAM|nr:hypothetical protein K503DRAFT_708818 [Rhizopogon vinicolor AM-OR11-026]